MLVSCGFCGIPAVASFPLSDYLPPVWLCAACGKWLVNLYGPADFWDFIEHLFDPVASECPDTFPEDWNA